MNCPDCEVQWFNGPDIGPNCWNCGQPGVQGRKALNHGHGIWTASLAEPEEKPL